MEPHASARFPLPVALLGRFLSLPKLDHVCQEARRLGEEDSFYSRLLRSLAVTCQCPPEDLKRIPATGPVIVVANHPFGLIEGPLMGDLLTRLRPDIRFLANSLLTAVPELREPVIPVDVFGGRAAGRKNARAFRESLDWLRKGGLLVVFPAGEVSSFRFPAFHVSDPPWNPSTARLVRLSGATVVPACFHGANGAGFHLAGLFHPGLRTALLPREFLNKRGRTIRLSFGAPISPQRFAALNTDEEATHYLRQRTYLLRTRQPASSQPHPPRRSPAPPIARDVLKAEIESLPTGQRLLISGDLSVFFASARQIPHALHEIGRLREIAFHQAGEGTGQPLDLDSFDGHYLHLFLWSHGAQEIAGAYRFLGTDSGGSLYTDTLFRLDPAFIRRLNPALELGRSFVRLEYQKNYQPLLLLWKGIGAYVSLHPRYRFLFGPVSISSDYPPETRDLMVAFLRSKCANSQLAALVKPKHAFRRRPARLCDIRSLGAMISDVDELSGLVADLEPGRKGIPVLLRQYLNVGGEVLEFSVDGAFSNVLDGLIVVDLLKTPRRLLDRYLGKPGASHFLAFQSSTQE